MNKIIILVFLAIACASCAPRVVSQSSVNTVNTAPGVKTSTATSTVKIGRKELKKIEEEWQEETITADGEAPVVAKYNDPVRDKMLAKKGAVLDAQRKLAEKISDIRISANTTMRDFQTSDVVRSKVDAYLQNIEVIREQYDEKNQLYKVSLEMPKVTLIRVLESTVVDSE